MTDHTLRAEVPSGLAGRAAIPWLVAAGAYLLLLLLGDRLLNDPDSYWHLVVGRWIVANGTFPHADTFSATFAGQPWIAKEWLSQVLYAGAHALGGWTAMAALAAAAIAVALGLLTHALLEKFEPDSGARPGARRLRAGLAPPRRPPARTRPAVDGRLDGGPRPRRRSRQSALVLAAAVDAAVGQPAWRLHARAGIGRPVRARRILQDRRTAPRWIGFGLAAGLAACITPYGPELILVTQRILGLGEALGIIVEWRPQDFSKPDAFEVLLLGGIGFVLLRGFTLAPIRVVVLLGLLHLALAHVRNAEVLGLLGPLLLGKPSDDASAAAPSPTLSIAVIAVLGFVTAGLAAMRTVAPGARITPAAALAAIERAKAGPIFNDYGFGGYLVHEGIAPFIDGRTELYGGAFTARHHKAVTLANLPDFLALLDQYKIGATLLAPERPAVALLDRLPVGSGSTPIRSPWCTSASGLDHDPRYYHAVE